MRNLGFCRRMDGMNDTMSRSPQLVKDEYIVLRVKTDFKEEQGREPTVQELARLVGILTNFPHEFLTLCSV